MSDDSDTGRDVDKIGKWPPKTVPTEWEKLLDLKVADLRWETKDLQHKSWAQNFEIQRLKT